MGGGGNKGELVGCGFIGFLKGGYCVLQEIVSCRDTGNVCSNHDNLMRNHDGNDALIVVSLVGDEALDLVSYKLV